MHSRLERPQAPDPSQWWMRPHAHNIKLFERMRNMAVSSCWLTVDRAAGDSTSANFSNLESAQVGGPTLNHRLLVWASHHAKRPVLHISLYCGVTNLPANKPLGIENGVQGVHCCLVFGGIANEALCVGEGHIRGCGTVSLVVCDDLHPVVLPDSNAGVGGSLQHQNHQATLANCCCRLSLP